MNDRSKERALTTVDYEKYNFRSDTKGYEVIMDKGLSEKVVREISGIKNEPKWMLDYRLNALEIFNRLPMPKWGGDLSKIDFNEVIYYMKSSGANKENWKDVPEYIKETFDRLGIPEAERKFLGGVGVQYESEVVYHSIREDLQKQGVVFLGMDQGLHDYGEIVREHFGTVVPSMDNKFAALNSAVWSGGSFVYVPPNVNVNIPLQAYFRINAQNMGQFERTLIIADKGAQVHYIEGCFTEGTPVITENGVKEIEKVEKGEKVLTHENRFMPVYHTQVRTYSGKLFEIEYFGDTSRKIHATEEHPFLAIKRQKQEYKNTDWNQVWVNASKLEKSDYLAIPIERETYSKEEMEFTVKIGKGRHGFKDEKIFVKTDKNFFRLIGYYLAEGSIVGGHYLHFTFNKNEKELIDDTKDLLKKYFGKDAFQQKEYKNGISIVLSSTKTARFFESQFGKGAAKKFVPNWARYEAPEKQAELIKGFWKGDGSFMLKQYSFGIKRMFRMNTISKYLATQLRDILLRLDIFASINLQKRTGNRKTMYCVYVGGSFLPKFTQIIETEIANEVAVQRSKMWQAIKETNAKSYAYIGKNYAFVPIKRISFKEVANLPVYNFSVKEDESYVAGGVVVHNCTAPQYSSDSLHTAVVEVIAKEDATVRYTTIQNWSNNIYNLVTKRAHAHKNSKVIWVDGNLGCLREGSTVTTPEGIKTIESLEIGDKVLSFDEQNNKFCFQPVTAKRFSGHQKVHTVSVGERKLEVTANHPFYSYFYNSNTPRKLGRYKLGYVRADQLKEAIIPCVSIDYGQPYPLMAPNLVTEFESMNQYAPDLVMTRQRESKMRNVEFTTEDIMWLFGYWIGDGDIEIRQGKTEGVVRFAKVGFSTPRKDRARAKLMQTMTLLIDAKPTERADGYHLAWNSKEMAEFLHINGFEGKAKDKRVPKWAWSLPESQRLAFIAGYIDADGYHKKRNFCIKSVNRPLLEDVASLLVTVGITPRIYTEFSEPRTVTIMGVKCTAHGAYSLSFNADERFFDFLTNTLFEKAKNQPERIKQTRRKVGRSTINLSTGTEIVPVNVSEQSSESVPTWDIEVLGTGNFLTQGFIVHNSRVTMKYPSIYLKGEGAKAEVLSVALAGKGQHQDAGAKAVHLASNTTSTITSKSISKDGGRASYRGLLKVAKGCKNVKSNVVCDALILDKDSRSDTYPTIEIDEPTATIAHEARVGKVGDDQIFYLMSRGLSEQEALTLIVMGFISPFTKALPMEYAIELNRLIEMEMEGSVG